MKVIDWLFRDRSTGKITIAQFPNPPLWIFFGAALLQRIAGETTTIGKIADYTASAALAWWAVDEIVRGVNPWRRVVGVGGVVFVIIRLVSSL